MSHTVRLSNQEDQRRLPEILEWARKTLREARLDLGSDLAGFSPADLLLDVSSVHTKFDLTIEDVKQILEVLGEKAK